MPHRPQQILSSLTPVDSGLPGGVEDSDSMSDTEIVWAKRARGVWGLANVFAGKLYSTRDVPEANCLPQGLEAPAKSAAKPAPKICQISCQTLQACSQTSYPGGSQACSQTCSWKAHSCGPCRARAALQGQILASEKVAHRACCSVNLNMHPCRRSPGHFVVHMPSYLHLWFCVVCPLSNNRGARKLSFEVRFLGDAREPSGAVAHWTRGGGLGVHFTQIAQ